MCLESCAGFFPKARAIVRRLGQKIGSESGNVTIIFALSVITMYAIASVAFDIQNTVRQKNKVQVVMDSAVLAAARVKQTGASNTEIKSAVQDFMDNQLKPYDTGFTCDVPSISIDQADSEIEVTARCAQDASLTRFFGQENMEFKVTSASQYGVGMIDVAFMFDVSGSMNSENRLKNLKSAAEEAIDVLLPEGASPELIENTRLSMVSYNSMIDAGDYFQAVAGVPATRTYYHTIPGRSSDKTTDQGRLFSELQIGLYNANTDKLISWLGDDAVIGIEDWSDSKTDDTVTIAVTVPSSSPLNGKVKSMRLELREREYKNRNDNSSPYTLYGGRLSNLKGKNWREGEFSITVRAYSKKNRNGTLLFDETIDFELFEEVDIPPRTVSYTLTSTCVWERDGAQKFTDSAPKAGDYLAHREAWFIENESYSNGGYWKTGNRNSSWASGTSCRDIEPLALTNNRDTLIKYVKNLTAGGGTAGHQGVAWSWYLVSEHWDNVFKGSSAPLPYDEPDSTKAVILMTDGQFNSQLFWKQGYSDGQARSICDQMRKTNIQVYAVALQAPPEGEAVLKYCATQPDFYFNANNGEQLSDAYRTIANQLSDLRISQ